LETTYKISEVQRAVPNGVEPIFWHPKVRKVRHSDVASFCSRLTDLSRIFIENGTGSASNGKTLTLCQKGSVKPSIGKS